MKTLLILIFISISSGLALADNLRCVGTSDSYAVTVTAKDNPENNLLSDYTIQIFSLVDKSLITDGLFQSQQLVYDRGVRAAKDVGYFSFVKLVFDGKRAVAIFAFDGTEAEQAPLTCQDATLR